MDELPSRALEVLRLARPLDDCMDPGARGRVRMGVAHAVGTATPGVADPHALPKPTAGSLGGLKVKLLLASTVLAVVGSGLALRHANTAQRAPTPLPSVAPHVDVAPEAAPPVPPPVLPAAPAAPTSKAKPAGTAARDTLAAEISLLRLADQATARGDAASAARILARHHARYPESVLAVEREGFDVLVRCLEQAPEAARSAREFVAQNPHSVLTRRVERACAGAQP